MGMAKRYFEEIASRGWADVDKVVCSVCINEEALADAIRAHSGKLACDYCELIPVSPQATAPVELVLELIVDGLRREYEDPNESMAWDGGWVGSVADTWDLLWDFEVTEREDVHDDLHAAIAQAQWCQRDPYAASPAEALSWGWDAFTGYVKHSRRYTFLTTDDTTAEGAGEIPMHSIPGAVARAVTQAGMMKTLPAGAEWWRVRKHRPSEVYTSPLDLGTPPDEKARDNRMSPKGIGVFYGASSPDGARAEVDGYAESDEAGTLARFLTKVPLLVVDLRDAPVVPSLFDAGRRHLRPAAQFMRDFIQNVTRIARPTDTQDLDYIPTQVIAETFRYELGAKGVLWRSTKDPGVTSCVLFVPADRVGEEGGADQAAELELQPSSLTRLSAPL